MITYIIILIVLYLAVRGMTLYLENKIEKLEEEAEELRKEIIALKLTLHYIEENNNAE